MEKKERAVLVALCLDGGNDKQEHSLIELHSLAETAGVEVVGEFTQNRSDIDRRYYIGPGKAKELADFVDEAAIDTVIFDRELSGSQVRNLERTVAAKVIDRSELIMDIFAQRARSKEGRLQVELAQLRYQLPKLVGRGRDLSRLAGGIGTRGPGESKLEVDRRRIRQRIHALEQQLQSVVKQRTLLRRRRSQQRVFQVALVGYTNSGKSTLLNQLTKATAYTDDILFATLDPLSRRLETARNTIIFTDTVGFISGLPHHLVAAFKGTLEEVVNADLLIHVVDVASPDMDLQVDEVNRLLADLACQEKKQIIAANKIDLLTDSERAKLTETFHDLPWVPISALTGFNTEGLVAIVEAETEPWENLNLLLPQPVFRRLAKTGIGILRPLEFKDNTVKVEAELPANIASTLRGYVVD